MEDQVASQHGFKMDVVKLIILGILMKTQDKSEKTKHFPPNTHEKLFQFKNSPTETNVFPYVEIFKSVFFKTKKTFKILPTT